MKINFKFYEEFKEKFSNLKVNFWFKKIRFKIKRQPIMLNFKNFKCRKKVNNIGRRPIKENFLFNFVEKWAPNRPKADKRGFYILNLIFVEKRASNRPKADNRGFRILHLILLKNEPPIGRRPITGDFVFCI